MKTPVSSHLPTVSLVVAVRNQEKYIACRARRVRSSGVDAAGRSPPADYASNKLDPSYPLGLDVEAFTLEALERAWARARGSYQRSHVTVYMYETPAEFRLIPVRDAVNRHDWRWTVDTIDDLEFVRAVFMQLVGSNEFDYGDVVNLIEKEPGIALINAHVRAKAVMDG